MSRRKNRKISRRKLYANRCNAAKSTGPRSARGKIHASRNALKHGLFAKTTTPIPQLGESPEELRGFITEFTRALKPTTPAEQALAHRAANTYYRLARIQKLESNILSAITDSDNPNAKPAAARLNSLIADAEEQLHNLHLLYTRVITDPLTFENPFYEDHEYLTINAINQYLAQQVVVYFDYPA